MTTTTYTRAQLIDALCHEYDYLCHDDFDPDVDMSPADYRASLDVLSHDQLVAETTTDNIYTLDEFMSTYV